MTRSSQGGQVQPLLTAPTDVTWQDKKGLYEVRYCPAVRNSVKKAMALADLTHSFVTISASMTGCLCLLTHQNFCGSAKYAKLGVILPMLASEEQNTSAHEPGLM